jgi:integrase
MGRYQKGYLYKAFGAWHIRYYQTEQVNGKPQRVQRSHRLEETNNQTKKTEARKLADNFMRTEVNAFCDNPTQGQDSRMLITEFWDKTYLPFCEKNKKASTVSGYKKLWKQLLQPAFVGIKLRDYKTHHATQFLTSLADTLGQRSIAHVRSLASGLFRHAKQLAFINENPWRDAQPLGKTKAPEETQAYSLEEAESIITALADHPQEQLIFSLACFAGLRPGEIAGLKWSDVELSEQANSSWLHVRRAVWRGIVGDTKTLDAVASVPLIKPVVQMFITWRMKSNPVNADGWVFPNRVNEPIDLHALARRVIIPVLQAKRLTWRGLYSGRRAAGTLLTQLTGDATAAFYVLRHKNLATTTGFYIKPSREAGVEGMRLLEETLANRKALTAPASGEQQG